MALGIFKYIMAAVILAVSIWYIVNPVSVVKGGQMERHLYKRPNRTRILWFVRIIGVAGIVIAVILVFYG